MVFIFKKLCIVVSVSVYDRVLIIMLMFCLYLVPFNSRIFQGFGRSSPLWNPIEEEARADMKL